MSTPTASGTFSKATPLHNAATPQAQAHLPIFTSPAPRSVPSPAAQRNQAGKSPYNASALSQGHPTVASSGTASKGLLGSSPAAVMMNFDSPLGMSFSLSQMGAADGGIAMTSGMSGFSTLGLMPMSGATSDEEKWRRLDEVIEKIKSRPGRPSPENVKMLAERYGFDVDMSTDNKGITTILVGGAFAIIEIEFNAQHMITKSDVSFDTSGPAVQKTGPAATKVFHDCLVPRNRSTITTTLDKFAINLEKLGKIDKPNGISSNGFNCFDAIAGIYESLRKLYDAERQVALDLYKNVDNDEDREEKATLEAICKRSGCPRMNEDGNIGLMHTYWLTRRHVRYPDWSRNWTDADQGQSSLPRGRQDDSGVFSLSIHCEAMHPGSMIQPARISEAWVSVQDDLTDTTAEKSLGNGMNWLEPATTFIPTELSADDIEGTMAEQAHGKLPNVRFVAKLHPPLLLPSHIAAQQGITPECTFQALPSYIAALLLHTDPLDSVTSVGQLHPRELRAERTILSHQGDGRTVSKYSNTLRVRNYDESILLQEIPFDHPKQLVQLLPLLRQFAFLNSLLKESFPISPATATNTTTSKTSKHNNSNSADLTFWTSPTPRLAFTFARSKSATENQDIDLDSFLEDVLSSESSSTLSATAESDLPPIFAAVTVLPNADIVIGDNNILSNEEKKVFGEESGGQLDEAMGKFSRALDVAGDIDVWAEYIQGRND